MIVSLGKIHAILLPSERARLTLLLALGLLGVATELLGVASLLPFLSLVGNPGLIKSSPILGSLYRLSGMDSDVEFIVWAGVSVFFLLTFANIYSAFYLWLTQRFQAAVQVSLSSRLLHAYLSRPFSSHLREGSAKPGSRILADTSLVASGIVVQLLRLNNKVGLAVAIFLGLLYLDPVVALASLFVFGGIYLWFYLFVRSNLRRLAYSRNEAHRLNYKYVGEAFSCIKEVKLLHCEKWALDRVRVQVQRAADATAYHISVSELPRYVIESTAFGCIIFTTLYLLGQEINIQAAVPTLGVFTLASYRLVSALQQCFSALAAMQASMPALNNVFQDLASGVSEDQAVSAGAAFQIREFISLDDIFFAYNDRESVFTGLSVRILGNTTIGFAGSTGSGKSTLINIFLGLLSPQSGRMVVDGVVIDSKNMRSWQRSVGHVPQDIVIIDDTVIRNVAFGVPDSEIDIQAVREACRQASIAAFIENELPGGYRTILGERGARLSGGQRQRVGIARALYCNPSVLILDEATSALDVVTERVVMEAVQELARSRTVILVAHRLSTLAVCDQVILLERGRIVAQGSYGEVLQHLETPSSSKVASSPSCGET